MTRARGTNALALADQALVSGSQFLTSVLLVRALGLATFGVYSLLWLGVLLAVGLQQALVGQPLMSIAPKLEGRARARYLGAVTALQLGYTALCATGAGLALALLLAHWDAPACRGTWAPLVAAIAARQLHGFVRTGFFVREERRAALANDLVAYPGQVVLLAGLWAAGRLEVASALWAVAAASGAAAVIGLARQGAWRTSRAEVARAARRHWRTGRWLAAMQFLQFFGANSFLVAVAALLGVGAVGVIKAAQTVTGVLHVGLLAMENVVPLNAARQLALDGRAGLSRYVRRVGLRGLLVCGAVSALLASMPRVVLRPLYGTEVSGELVFALRGFCVLLLFSFLINLQQIAFRTLERTAPVFLAYALNTTLVVIVAEPVVAAHGFEGALVGIVLQQALLAGLLAVAFVTIVARGQRGGPIEAAAVQRACGGS